MKIMVEPNVRLPEVPDSIDLADGGCLRDALRMVIPQVVDGKTGEYLDDPDIWDIKLNEVSFWQLKEGMDTALQAGDVVQYRLRYLVC